MVVGWNLGLLGLGSLEVRLMKLWPDFCKDGIYPAGSTLLGPPRRDNKELGPSPLIRGSDIVL